MLSLLLYSCTGNSNIRESIVAVISIGGEGSSSGTGFFVQDDNGNHYVVTNFHVIESGGDIVVAKTTEAKGNKTYLEAYPEVRIAGFNAEADIAILELKNVPKSKMPPLKIGTPEKDQEIDSWGYPSSNLTLSGGIGLIKTQGIISNFIKMPYIDRVTGNILKENAIDALVVSTNLEPGFSGGPTVNKKGQVVGINVAKDTEHEGQDACLNVQLLKDMLSNIKKPSEPSQEDVLKMINDIQSQYLDLGQEEKVKINQSAFTSLINQPRSRKMFLESQNNYSNNNSIISISDDISVSPSAAFGYRSSKLYGKEFQSWKNENTQSEIKNCVKQINIQENFLESFGNNVNFNKSQCTEKAYRMFIWDLVASTLRWDGKKVDYEVSNIETISEENYLYKVNINKQNRNSFPIYVSNASGKLVVSLYDNSGKLYALNSEYRYTEGDFEGIWVRKEKGIKNSQDPKKITIN